MSAPRVPVLVVVGGTGKGLGRTFRVDHELRLGRAGEADAWLTEEGVSRLHARVVRTESGARVVDLASRNGTFVNGTRVQGEADLQEGDLLHLGPIQIVRLTFQDSLQQPGHLGDAVTVTHRQTFLDQLHKDVSSALRHQQSLSLARIDLDRLQQLMELHGQRVRELALRHLARVTATLIRSEDTLTQLGEHAFGLILRHCALPEAQLVCERIRACAEELDLMQADQHVPITVSIGLTALVPGLATADSELLELAETALHQAHRDGRNRVHAQPLG